MPWAEGLRSPDGTMCLVGCGSRHWADEVTVAFVLERIRARYPLLSVTEGGGHGVDGAPGADLCVAEWAANHRTRGVHWIHRSAHWHEYEQYERAKAAHRRNEIMIADLIDARAKDHGVLVVAFKSTLDPRLLGQRPNDARGGTEDVIRRAWANGINVLWVRGHSHTPEWIGQPTLL